MTNTPSLTSTAAAPPAHGLVMLPIRHHHGDQVTVINWPAEARAPGLAVAPEWSSDYGAEGNEWTGDWNIIHVPSGGSLLYSAICLRHARQVADELAELPIDWTMPSLERNEAVSDAALPVLRPWLHGTRRCQSRCRASTTNTSKQQASA